MTHVFIIGSRGLPAMYGGFETFVEELVKNRQSDALTYHVACLSDTEQHTHFDVMGADCFTINPPQLGPARVIAYDMMAISYALTLVKKQGIKRPIFYVLGNTIGPMMAPFVRRIHAVGGVFYINPDGLEWKRAKWPKPVRAYLKLAEKAMTRVADLVIADNSGIEKYIQSEYPWSKTMCIAYGTDTKPSQLTAGSETVKRFFNDWSIKEKAYYLIVGRFVPENNYETMISEFMRSETERDLVIICNHDGNPYFNELLQKTHFDQDKRVKFVGTVYDRELLTYIRQSAFAYIHGHEVGGTNPGLLEALSYTDMNLIFEVTFNQEVARDNALYWRKDMTDLAKLIDSVDGQSDFSAFGQKAKAHIKEQYSWQKIVREYEDLFLNES